MSKVATTPSHPFIFAVAASLILLLQNAAVAQVDQLRERKNLDPIICYQNRSANRYHVEVPDAFKNIREIGSGRTKTANIEVEYINFPVDNAAKNAFQFAVDIWESQLNSSIKIKMRAQWGELEDGVLGQAVWGSAFANFNGAQHQNVYYPVALAEKISGQELNPTTEPDIVATFNSNGNWYFGTDGKTTPGKMDLVTVVLHEICHGLGFIDTYASSGGQGTVGLDEIPFVYDLFVVNSSKENLFSGFSSPSTSLNSQLISNNLFYNSPLASPSGILPKVYAPSPFDAGSSVAHLDESSFSTPGNANNLMTPKIAAQEAIHQPGPIALAILSEIGWTNTRIDHTPLKDTEIKNGIGYPVTVSITSDNGYKTGTVMLNYRSASNAAYTKVQMSPTSVANQFQAMLPGSVSNISYAYFVTVEDNLARTFRNPGLQQTQGQASVQGFHVINIGPDAEAPVIAHTPIDFIFEDDAQIIVNAAVTDNINVGSVSLEFQIDGGATQTIAMTKIGSTDNYTAAIAIPISVSVGDLIKYKIIARDASANPNQTLDPTSGLYTVFVTGDIAPQASYVNDFNTASFDFIGNTFSIHTPAGFSDGAIHSEHPYANGSGANNESNYTYQLQVPIIVSPSNHFIRFDEIVLVEPGEDGSEFGDEDFFDYVIVEASKDDGTTWLPLEDGYDSRANTAWLTRYNSNLAGDNSQAMGTPLFFRERQIDIFSSNTIKAGNEIKIRFRLFADQAAHGWGWAIDNLSIQGPVTSTEYQAIETLNVFPNPANDLISFRGAKINSTIEIFDTSGRKVVEAVATERQVNVDIHDLSPGLYLVNVLDGQTISRHKFVKSK